MARICTVDVCVREVARRADKRCPARCVQGDRAACSAHRNMTIQFPHRDLQRVRTPFVEKSEFHAHAFDEGDARNQSRAAFPEGRRRSSQALVSFCARIFSGLLERCSNGVARLVEQLTDDRAFLFGEGFHSLAPLRDAAAFAEIFYSDCFRAISVPRSFNFAQRLIAELFQRVHGFRESLNRYIVKSGNRISIHQSRFTITPLSFSISLCLPARFSLDQQSI